MALISLSGVHASDWTFFEDDSTVAEGADALVSLNRLEAEAAALTAVAGRLAVEITGGADYQRLLPHIGLLGAVIIRFPKFSDGRGFSLAGRIRRDLGYQGEIRAVGDIIPDQALFLLRSGFDSAESADARAMAFEEVLARYPHYYQHTVNGDTSAAHQRHARHAAPLAAAS